MKEDKGKEKAEEGNATEGSGSVSGGVLDSVDNLIPGLGGVIKGLKKVDAFKEKFALIEEEIERRLGETQLRETDSNTPGAFARAGRRPPSGIPPSVARRGSRPKKRFDAFATGYHPIDKSESDVFVDIFEEEKKIRVIAELPGVNEENISLDLNADTLIISASRENRTYYKNVKLPRTSESITGKIYNNGILEVVLS